MAADEGDELQVVLRRRWSAAVGLLAAALAVVIVVAAGVLWARSSGAASGGPLQTAASAAVSISVGASQSVTWGAVLPQNAGDVPIEITRIEAINPTRIEILEIAFNHPWAEGAIGLVRTFPPPGVTMHLLAPVALPPHAGPDGDVQVLIGARLASMGAPCCQRAG